MAYDQPAINCFFLQEKYKKNRKEEKSTEVPRHKEATKDEGRIKRRIPKDKPQKKPVNVFFK